MTNQIDEFNQSFSFSFKSVAQLNSRVNLSTNYFQLNFGNCKIPVPVVYQDHYSQNEYSQSIEETEQVDTVSAKDLKFLHSFRRLIAESYHSQDLCRTQVASMLHIGERHLNRKLSNLTTTNFTDYLRRYRLKKAVSLLGQGYQVAEIAEKVGFSDTSYFCSCFKKEFGKTVRQYEIDDLGE